MRWHEDVRRALAGPDRATAVDEDVVEELAQHAEAAYEAARADGLGEEDAAAHVRGLVDGWSGELVGVGRRPRRPPLVEPPPSTSRGPVGLALDVRFGLRQIRRHPGFALGAAGTMALGVAAATTIFSLAHGVLMKPLPWPQAERLVRITETREGSTRLLPPLLTNGTYLAWQDRHEVLAEVAVYHEEASTLELADGGPERVAIVAATASLFPLLGVQPASGRFFADHEEAMGSEPVAVLSHAAWLRRFGGDPAAVGRVVRLDGKPHTVVGVLPPGTEFPTPQVELLVPLHVPPVEIAGRDGQSVALLASVGRLAPDATLAQAAAEGTARGRAAPPLGLVGMAVFGAEGPPVVTVEPLAEAWTGEVRTALLLLLGAAGLLLASAVANVAGMQLARALASRRDVAIRAAIGAGRGRIARQLLVENALLGALAGAAGLLLAWSLHRLLPALMPGDFPRLHEVQLDVRVAAFGLGVALLAGLALGLFPVLLTRRLSLTSALVGDGQLQLGGSLRLSVARGRAAIMTVQVAVALVLLAGAGLLARTFWSHWQADRGYEPRNLLTAQLPMSHDAFDGERRAAVLDALLERAASLPGVEAAAATNVLPLVSIEAVMGFELTGPDGQPVQAQAAARVVSPGYFSALGMRLVAGRLLLASDTADSLPVVVVNRAFVSAYDRGVGSELPLGFRSDETSWQIAGVVEDVRQQAATDSPRPEVFASYRQLPGGFESPLPTVVLRTQGDPRQLTSLLRAVVHEVAPTVAVDSVMTMEERLAASLARPRLYAILLGAFAGFASLVTGIGLFGVLSYTVAQRWRELGVRAALGASPREVARLVVQQCLRVTAAGIALGLAASLVLRQGLAHLLYGVGAGDPLTWTAAAALVVAVALLACVLPARRAARIDPVRALLS